MLAASSAVVEDHCDSTSATIHASRFAYSQQSKADCPFPADPHYDRKAWEICRREHGDGVVAFWCVTGPAEAS